jgi:hypothetical protein
MDFLADFLHGAGGLSVVVVVLPGRSFPRGLHRGNNHAITENFRFAPHLSHTLAFFLSTSRSIMASSKPLHESAKRLLQALVEAPSTGSTLDDVLFGVSKNIIEEAYLQLLEGKTKVEIEGQGDRLSAYLVRQNEGDRREVLSLREIDVTKESLKSLFQFEGHQSAQGEVEEREYLSHLLDDVTLTLSSCPEDCIE